MRAQYYYAHLTVEETEAKNKVAQGHVCTSFPFLRKDRSHDPPPSPRLLIVVTEVCNVVRYVTTYVIVLILLPSEFSVGRIAWSYLLSSSLRLFMDQAWVWRC